MGNKVMEPEWPLYRLWAVSFQNKGGPLGDFRRMPGDCSFGKMSFMCRTPTQRGALGGNGGQASYNQVNQMGRCWPREGGQKR